jgi:hypothetical protein
VVKCLGIVAVLACSFVAQASAKGPILLCGTGGCVPLGSEGIGLGFLREDRSHAAAVGPAPFFRLRFGDRGGSLAYWVPGAGVMRTGLQSGYGVWEQLQPEESALLTRTATTLRPYVAPRRARVTVGNYDVRRGASTYFRLYAMGAPVSSVVGVKGWIRLSIWAGDSPWTATMWISSDKSFLDRGGDQIVRLPPRVASLIRHRLPLPG